jgi:hypothetical protein
VPEVDVEQYALRAFDEHVATRVQRPAQQANRVGDERLQSRRVADVLLDDRVRVERRAVVERLHDHVALGDVRVHPTREMVAIEQLGQADAGARRAIGVSRSDSAPGRADARTAAAPLRQLVHRLVVREHHVRELGHEQVAFDLHAASRELFDLAEQLRRIDDHAVADDVDLAVQDPGRDQVEDELLIAHLDRVAGIRATLVADDHVGSRRDQVDDLSFSFVAPLGADDARDGHGIDPPC